MHTNFFSNFVATLSDIDLIIITASLLLFFAAQPICRTLNNSDGLSSRVSMMRIVNFLIIAVVMAHALWFANNIWFSKITQCLMVVYFAMLSTQTINFFVRRHFGKQHQSNHKTIVSDTYSSRGLSLFVITLISVVVMVSCLRILGFSSLLETGGAIGILGFFMVMTQAAWAPDIISGLIILNSRLCQEGDVVQFTLDGDTKTASIFRTKLFHTEFLDLTNNHRFMVRNAKLRDLGLQNLSRFASAKGLREHMLFNIDYQYSQAQVSDMILRAFEQIDNIEGLREEQFNPEILVYATGDYAVTWAVYYYIKDVKQLLRIKQIFRSYVLAESIRSNIPLSTPILHQNKLEFDNLNSAHL